MPELVANCPRCGTKKITFNVSACHKIGQRHGWQNWYETYAICRHCDRATNFVLKESVNGNYEYVHKVGLLKLEGSLNNYLEIDGHVSLRDSVLIVPPEHMPDQIASAFKEGTICLTVGCYNAAATMFRLCVDHATRSLLPTEGREGLNHKVKRDLGLRLPWLFGAGLLSSSLSDLSACIKEDGNDGAHAGTLKKSDAEDLLDFTTALLERIYTEPTRLQLALERRETRRGKVA